MAVGADHDVAKSGVVQGIRKRQGNESATIIAVVAYVSYTRISNGCAGRLGYYVIAEWARCRSNGGTACWGRGGVGATRELERTYPGVPVIVACGRIILVGVPESTVVRWI